MMKAIKVLFFAIPFFIAHQSFGGDGVPEIFTVRWNDYIAKQPGARADIQLDKSVYNPGDNIWFRVVIADYFNGTPTDESGQLKMSIRNLQHTTVLSLSYDVSHGLCVGHFPLPKTMSAGNYYVSVTGKDLPASENSFREIVVKEAVVPAFIINAEIPNKAYRPGETVEGRLKFMDYYHEPLRGMAYEVVFNDGSEVQVAAGKTGKTGDAVFKYTIPSKLPSGILSFKVTANKKQQYEVLEGLVPVSGQPVYLNMQPEGGTLLAGVENKVAFQCTDATGEPYKFEGQVLDAGGKSVSQVKSNANGLGHFAFVPKANEKYTLHIVKPYSLDKTYDLPTVNSTGFSMRLLENGEHEIKLQVLSPQQIGNTAYLIARNGRHIFWSKALVMQDSMVVRVPLPAVHNRILFFSLFDLGYVPQTEMAVMTKPANLSLQVTTDKKDYGTREKTVASVKVSGAGSDMLENVSFSAVHHTWTGNQKQSGLVQMLNFPVDFGGDPLFRAAWENGHLSAADSNDLMMLYHPSVADWSSVMGTKSSYIPPQREGNLMKNMAVKRRIEGFNDRVFSDKQIEYSNTTTDSYFLTSNPEYINFLNTKVIKHEEAYKSLLQNGSSLKEVVNAIKPYSLENNKIVFMGGHNSLNYQDGALIVVDGSQLGTDASVLDNISPYVVEKIFVSTNPSDIQRYTGLNSVGLIEITTKRGGEGLEETVAKEYDPKEQFQSPDYAKGSKNKTDYRPTLQWDPAVQMQGGQATIAFYNADLRDMVDITVTAIDKQGHATSATTTYTVGGLNK